MNVGNMEPMELERTENPLDNKENTFRYISNTSSNLCDFVTQTLPTSPQICTNKNLHTNNQEYAYDMNISKNHAESFNSTLRNVDILNCTKSRVLQNVTLINDDNIMKIKVDDLETNDPETTLSDYKSYTETHNINVKKTAKYEKPVLLVEPDMEGQYNNGLTNFDKQNTKLAKYATKQDNSKIIKNLDFHVTSDCNTKNHSNITSEEIKICGENAALVKEQKFVNPNSFENKCKETYNESLIENMIILDESHSTQSDMNETIREIHTEDMSTKKHVMKDTLEDYDMINFGESSNKVNNDNGEIFIDAKTFEFFLNQSKSSVVIDKGKESLFLKFDPLFAHRVSLALNKVHENQKTSKKTLNVEGDICQDNNISSLYRTNTQLTCLSENTNNNNKCISGMTITPRLYTAVSRNSTTPTRLSKQLISLSSPEMAAFDQHLISNDTSDICLMDQDIKIYQCIPEQIHTNNITITCLREMLTGKEMEEKILRTENKDLKDKLTVVETEMESLKYEIDGRLRKISNLKERLDERTEMAERMTSVVDEYERTVASIASETEQEKSCYLEDRKQLIRKCDELARHLSSVEHSYNDLLNKYEKTKQIILSFKANEEEYKKSIEELEESLLRMQNNYDLLNQHATTKLNHTNEELEKMREAHKAEVIKLSVMIKRKDLCINSLEATLNQKTEENEKLKAICDEIQKSHLT
ncbi:transforming acidic coiled-coil-containing protein 3-like [Leptidea sinapis]|uniref:transforming acidic coiled-coil-containing protein 3-like n=1 Tax=Leptidea sinapis TaxID=189913 RepID=UPI00212FB328|nr:transforming acidic coiled-coil-containing protein 3-like [Leptidea sinapis]